MILKYNHAKCTRDLGLIFDAARYDAMLDTNYASIITAYSYPEQAVTKFWAIKKMLQSPQTLLL